MNKTDIARVAHEVNRAYCLSIGDASVPAWNDATDSHKASILAGVDLHLANPDTTPEQSHESWLAAKLADGWVFGAEKDTEAKVHPCCVPYADLPESQKSKDYLFKAVVASLSGQLKAVSVDAPKQAPVIEQLPDVVNIEYIGAKAEYRDKIYKSGLTFAPGQIRAVSKDLARRFLKHTDLFAIAKSAPKLAKKDDDDTADLIAAAKAKTKDLTEAERRVQDMHDRVNYQMDKPQVIEFIKLNFNLDVAKQTGLPALREKAITLINQYGLPA